jgi:alkylresorcinol/alkylpyrone synthase
LTWQRNDLSLANVISSGLFGDGSAAVIVSGSAREVYGPEVVASASSFYRGTEDVMGWDISSDGFNIVLSSEVPNLVTKHLGRDIDAFLTEHGLLRGDIATWIMHTGGPKVLEATAKALGLSDDALQVSWDCLKRVESFVGVGTAGVGRVNEPAAPCAWGVRHPGCHGFGLLHGTRIVAMVVGKGKPKE